MRLAIAGIPLLTVACAIALFAHRGAALTQTSPSRRSRHGTDRRFYSAKRCPPGGCGCCRQQRGQAGQRPATSGSCRPACRSIRRLTFPPARSIYASESTISRPTALARFKYRCGQVRCLGKSESDLMLAWPDDSSRTIFCWGRPCVSGEAECSETESDICYCPYCALRP